MHHIEAENLPEINQAGQIDVGVIDVGVIDLGVIDVGEIDLRDRLISHRLDLRVAEGAPRGAVRVAMFFGLPPVGPSGEPVSLGSRQFPPVALGSEMEWRGGYQRLFGPFSSADLPTELIMD